MNYYDVQAISNSTLSYINPEQGGTPRKFKKLYIDRERDEEETPSLKNGKLIHKYIEDKASFVISDVVRPTEMLASWVERVCNRLLDFRKEDVVGDNLTLKITCFECRDGAYASTKDEDKVWLKFQEGFDYLKHLIRGCSKIVIDTPTRNLIERCIESINNNGLAQELLFRSGDSFGDCDFNEMALYWEEEVNGIKLPCKGLVDRLRVFPQERKFQLIDAKSTSKPGVLYKESFEFYRTYRQLATYRKGVLNFLKKSFPHIETWEEEYYIVSIETYGLFECHVHEVDYAWIEVGEEERNSLLKRITFHMKRQDWTISADEFFNKGKLKLVYEKNNGFHRS